MRSPAGRRSRLICKDHANGHRHAGGVFGGSKLAGHGIDAENVERIRLLIRGDEPLTVGREVEVAGIASAGGRVAGGGEFAGVGIKREDGDAVVPAIRAVNEFAIGMHTHFRRGAVAREIGGESGLSIDFGECAGVSVVGVGGQGAVEFVDDEDVFAIAAKRGVSRAGTGGGGDKRCRGGRERGIGGVERVGEDLVETEIANDHEAIVGRDMGRVHVRGFLPIRIHAATAVLMNAFNRTERSVFMDRHRYDFSAVIMRDDEAALRRIDHQMAGSFAAAVSGFIGHEFAGLEIDGEGRGHGRIDALAGGAGVGADVDQVFGSGSGKTHKEKDD